MDQARTQLAEYGRDLAALLTALETRLDPEQLLALADRATTSFDGASRMLGEASADERVKLDSQLAQLRRSAALAQDAAQRCHAQTGERLVELARARQILSDLDQRGTGALCDIAG